MQVPWQGFHADQRMADHAAALEKRFDACPTALVMWSRKTGDGAGAKAKENWK
jgi:hypothetical protein